jgi:DNA-binding response OmpR family regulator
LCLDLFARDGFVRDKPLALHPREFAPFWPLADTPGIAVGKRVLLTEVWRLCPMPDTTILAVHLFRLSAKLAGAGLAGLVQTALSGGACNKDLVVARNTPGSTIEGYHHEL